MQRDNVTQFLVWGYSSIGIDDGAATKAVDRSDMAPECEPELHPWRRQAARKAGGASSA
jgi:hypothetical protein